MSKCVYTGARVFIEEYQCIGHADIHALDPEYTVLIINFNPLSFSHTGNHASATHVVEIGSGYWHEDKTFLVVFADQLSGELR